MGNNLDARIKKLQDFSIRAQGRDPRQDDPPQSNPDRHVRQALERQHLNFRIAEDREPTKSEWSEIEKATRSTIGKAYEAYKEGDNRKASEIANETGDTFVKKQYVEDE